jgi:hypothetical protein
MNETTERESHISLDLETMGLVPGRAVLSIGAITFDPGGEERWGGGEIFHIGIDLISSLLAGMTIDPETVEWWRGPKVSDEARRLMLELEKVPLEHALDLFDEWCRDRSVTHVWANGPAADVVWLEACYTACGRRPPWSHRGVRCYRTIVEIAGLERRAQPIVEHDALADATAQALDVQSTYRRIRQWRLAYEATTRAIQAETASEALMQQRIDGTWEDTGLRRAVPRHPPKEQQPGVVAELAADPDGGHE